jgi:N-formylglutamate amidohydrolase
MIGEVVPGVLEVIAPRAPAVPVFFDSPHSGTVYPADFRPAAPMNQIRKAEDTHVEDLYGRAPDHGAPLLLAHFPRAYLDPNRDEKDIDPELLAEPWPGPISPGVKTQEGHGLIWRLVGANGLKIYDRRLSAAEVRNRIETYHAPYHARMRRILDGMHGMFGAVWHVNCHSMQAVGGPSAPDAGRPRADFVLGDRDGTTCHPDFTNAVAEALRGMGYRVAINDPYKGVELVRRYGDPARRRHSLQIEINRALYMYEDTLERLPGYPAFKADIERLIGSVVAFALKG